METTPRKAGRPKKSETPAHDAGSKERILSTALHLFALKGFDGTTVQEIVDQAQSNVSMISYYFGGKENLYRACLDFAVQAPCESMDRILAIPKTREEFILRVRMFIEEMIVFHQENGDLTTILNNEFSNPSPAVRGMMEDSFYKTFNNFTIFCKGAQKAKILREDLDVQTFSLVYFNSFLSLCPNDACAMVMLKKDLKDLKFREKIVECLCGPILQGALA